MDSRATKEQKKKQWCFREARQRPHSRQRIRPREPRIPHERLDEARVRVVDVDRVVLGGGDVDLAGRVGLEAVCGAAELGAG